MVVTWAPVGSADVVEAISIQRIFQRLRPAALLVALLVVNQGAILLAILVAVLLAVLVAILAACLMADRQSKKGHTTYVWSLKARPARRRAEGVVSICRVEAWPRVAGCIVRGARAARIRDVVAAVVIVVFIAWVLVIAGKMCLYGALGGGGGDGDCRRWK